MFLIAKTKYHEKGVQLDVDLKSNTTQTSAKQSLGRIYHNA